MYLHRNLNTAKLTYRERHLMILIEICHVPFIQQHVRTLSGTQP